MTRMDAENKKTIKEISEIFKNKNIVNKFKNTPKLLKFYLSKKKYIKFCFKFKDEDLYIDLEEPNTYQLFFNNEECFEIINFLFENKFFDIILEHKDKKENIIFCNYIDDLREYINLYSIRSYYNDDQKQIQEIKIKFEEYRIQKQIENF